MLKEVPHPGELDNEMIDSQFNPLKIDVFVQTLLNLGSKSFSHSFAAIAKFHTVFKVSDDATHVFQRLCRATKILSFVVCVFFRLQALGDSEEAQICILHNVFELWRNHRQMMCVLVDKLLKTQIVECSAVATWVFSKEMNSEFTKLYLWEILHLTIKKMNKHVIRLGEYHILLS